MQTIIKKTLECLKEGKVILYPTDTVWGIGCDIFNKHAVSKIYQIKQREDSKSLIILVSDLEMLKQYVSIENKQLKLLEESDKPTTVIYPTPTNIPSYLQAKDGSIAIRVINNEFCKKLIQDFGKPIISTSANISGKQTPSNFLEIDKTILSGVDYVVNWRQHATSGSKPSKIVQFLEGDKIKVIRE